jgi:hypothetical protein
MKKTIIALFLAATVIRCAQNRVIEKPEPGKWSGKMHELSAVLSSLYPYLWSREEFYKEKNQPEIESKVKQFADLAHTVNSKSLADSPDADPAVKFLASDFDADISRAYDAFRSGSKEFSRQTLAMAANHCIACHSRNQSGPQFQSLNLNFDLEKLNPFVRAEAYMATRQFKKAANEFALLTARRDYIANYPFEIERALKKGLSIHIRVFNDVNGALKFTDSFLSIPDKPMFLERQAVAWKKELLNWKNEETRGLTKSSYIKKIDDLLDSGEKENPFINYLRASALGHLYLSKYRNDSSVPEVLYKMGVLYERLEDLGYWTLSDNYYTQCIREKPHSPIALKCLYRYEQNVYMGYTGSAGTHLPPEVRAQLRELKELAL